MVLTVPDSDRSPEVNVKHTPSISTTKSIEEPDALMPFQKAMIGNKSVDNSCGSLSVMVLSFGASTTDTMFGTSN